MELLVESLSSGMDWWIKKISNTEVSVSAVGIQLKLNPLGSHRNPLDGLNQLLEGVADSLPSTTLLRGIQSPVLCIDEANRLRTLLRDGDGQAALKSLFEWLIMHTKEKNHFHVVLASSDSFFNLWVERFIGPSRYNTYVLGHLDKADVEMYWDKIFEENEHLLKSMDPPPHSKQSIVCGGSIFY